MIFPYSGMHEFYKDVYLVSCFLKHEILIQTIKNRINRARTCFKDHIRVDPKGGRSFDFINNNVREKEHTLYLVFKIVHCPSV